MALNSCFLSDLCEGREPSETVDIIDGIQLCQYCIDQLVQMVKENNDSFDHFFDLCEIDKSQFVQKYDNEHQRGQEGEEDTEQMGLSDEESEIGFIEDSMDEDDIESRVSINDVMDMQSEIGDKGELQFDHSEMGDDEAEEPVEEKEVEVLDIPLNIETKKNDAISVIVSPNKEDSLRDDGTMSLVQSPPNRPIALSVQDSLSGKQKGKRVTESQKMSEFTSVAPGMLDEKKKKVGSMKMDRQDSSPFVSTYTTNSPEQQPTPEIQRQQSSGGYSMETFDPGVCPLHNRPLEVVDLTDKKLICPKCALFGSGGTMNHVFKELSDVIQSVFDRAEKIFESMTATENKEQYLLKGEFLDQMLSLINDKKMMMINQFEEKFRVLFMKLKRKKESMLYELEDKFKKFENSLTLELEFPQRLKNQVSSWKMEAKGKMARFADCSQNEIAFDVLHDIGAPPETDILFRGESLIEKMQEWEGEISGLLLQRIDMDDLDINEKKFDSYLDKIVFSWDVSAPVLRIVEKEEKLEVEINSEEDDTEELLKDDGDFSKLPDYLKNTKASKSNDPKVQTRERGDSGLMNFTNASQLGNNDRTPEKPLGTRRNKSGLFRKNTGKMRKSTYVPHGQTLHNHNDMMNDSISVAISEVGAPSDFQNFQSDFDFGNNNKSPQVPMEFMNNQNMMRKMPRGSMNMNNYQSVPHNNMGYNPMLFAPNSNMMQKSGVPMQMGANQNYGNMGMMNNMNNQNPMLMMQNMEMMQMQGQQQFNNNQMMNNMAMNNMGNMNMGMNNMGNMNMNNNMPNNHMGNQAQNLQPNQNNQGGLGNQIEMQGNVEVSNVLGNLTPDVVAKNDDDSEEEKSHKSNSKKGPKTTKSKTSKKSGPRPANPNMVEPTPAAKKLLKRQNKLSSMNNKARSIIEDTDSSSIDISLCNIGDEGMAGLYKLIKDNKNIKSLKMMKNNIRDDGASILFRALCFNKTIEIVNLNINFITEKMLPSLVKLAKVNQTLKKIYLSQNTISSRNAKKYVEELKELGITLTV